MKMSDLINRKWLMECVDEGWIKFDTEKDTNTYIHLIRDIAPSVKPEQRWVQCSERLPEYGEAVLTIDKDEEYEINHVIDEDDGEWFIDGVIAWTPLPSYKEVE